MRPYTKVGLVQAGRTNFRCQGQLPRNRGWGGAFALPQAPHPRGVIPCFEVSRAINLSVAAIGTMAAFWNREVSAMNIVLAMSINDLAAKLGDACYGFLALN